MQLNYAYRWWYFLVTMILSLTLAYVGVLAPYFEELTGLQQSLLEVETQLANLPIVPHKKEKNITTVLPSLSENLASILTLSASHGLKVKEAKLSALPFIQGQQQGLIVSVSGSFSSISQFLFTLNQVTFHFLFIHLTLEIQKAGEVLAEFSLLPNDSESAVMEMNIPTFTNAPFCLTNGWTISHVPSQNVLQHLTLAQMKLVGIFDDNRHPQALFWLPNQTLVPVAPGAIIGRERAKVDRISKDHVRLHLPNQTPLTLTLTGSLS